MTDLPLETHRVYGVKDVTISPYVGRKVSRGHRRWIRGNPSFHGNRQEAASSLESREEARRELVTKGIHVMDHWTNDPKPSHPRSMNRTHPTNPVEGSMTKKIGSGDSGGGPDDDYSRSQLDGEPQQGSIAEPSSTSEGIYSTQTQSVLAQITPQEPSIQIFSSSRMTSSSKNW